MNIEEKAKAYDEAIEKARMWKEKSGMPADRQGILDDIFPELAESEDEKIRKALIDYFDDANKADENPLQSYGVHTDKAIAWLEKQGEQKPNYCHHEVDLSNCSEEYRKAYYDGWNNCNMQHSQCKSELDAVVKCLINGMKFNYEDNEEATWGTDKWSMPVKYIIEVLEKQVKNNMGISEDTKQELKDNLNKALEKETPESYNEFLDEQGEQKPVEPQQDMLSQEQYAKAVDECIYGEQKSAWSEEDDAVLNALTRRLEGEDVYVSPHLAVECLKSLRPQSQWKPSEEQIEALKTACDEHWEPDGLDPLYTLYQDLKKLKE